MYQADWIKSGYDRHTDRQIDTDRQINRQIDRETARQIDSQMERQIDTQTDRDRYTQIDRQRDIHKYRQRDSIVFHHLFLRLSHLPQLLSNVVQKLAVEDRNATS